MNSKLKLISYYFLTLTLIAFACKENEAEIEELSIQKTENTFDIEASSLTIKSTITFNRKPDSDDKIYFEMKNNVQAGVSNSISDNVVELKLTVHTPNMLLSFIPQVEKASGLRIKGEPINLSYHEKGDYWLELKRFPIHSNAESSIPFVFGDKVYFAGLGNFHNSTHGYSYELDMPSLTFEKKDYMPIPTFRKYGFQLGNDAYIGECLRVTDGNTSSCTSETVTYKYSFDSKKWTQNTDTVSWSLAFVNERHVGFILENKAYNYHTYSGNIHVFDETQNKWSFVSTTEGLLGNPWAEVVDNKLYLSGNKSNSIIEVDVQTGNVIQSYPFPTDEGLVDTSSSFDAHSFTLNGKIFVRFGGSNNSSNFFFDTKSKEWGKAAPAPNMNTDFFAYKGSIYKTNRGIDHNMASEDFTSLWKYFPN